MAKHKRVDWDSVEPLFRAGSLSLTEICNQYEADHKNSQTFKKTITHPGILKHAKKNGWKRNLTKQVSEKIRERLVTGSVTNCNQKTDREIIEQVAELGSNVVLRHRKEIYALLKIEDDLLAELTNAPEKTHFASYQGEIVSQNVGLTVSEKAATLKALAEVRAKRIQIERQAYSLDDDSGTGESFKVIISSKEAGVL